MRDLNSVNLIGRLTADAKMKSFDNGFQIIEFNIACNSSQKTKEGKYEDYPNFFSIKYPGKSLDKLLANLIKGKLVGINGSLRQDRWEKDGQKNSLVCVEAASIELLGTGGSKEGSQPTENGTDGDFPF